MSQRGFRRVALGRDGRLSSPRFRDSLVEGMVSGGLEVIDIGSRADVFRQVMPPWLARNHDRRFFAYAADAYVRAEPPAGPGRIPMQGRWRSAP